MFPATPRDLTFPNALRAQVLPAGIQSSKMAFTMQKSALSCSAKVAAKAPVAKANRMMVWRPDNNK